MTTRHGGTSQPPFDSLNLHAGIGDDPGALLSNQAALQAAMNAQPVFLNQVHGIHVVRLTAADAIPTAPTQAADASFTTEPGVACVVRVADCLPVLFAAPMARAVAAAHAGWRGLSAGILQATLHELCAAAPCAPEEVQVWLGACIGPTRFEVGTDVLEAFGQSAQTFNSVTFAPYRPGKWLAHLPQLAQNALQAEGVRFISRADQCTFNQPSKFYSFRREPITGRMVAAVWIEG
jgi:polyphenol oxidase